MKNLALVGILMLMIVAISPACSKGNGGGNTDCTETGIGFTSTPAVNSNQTPAPGPDFPLSINISDLPNAGATIKITARPESPANATAFFTTTKNTQTAQNNFQVTGAAINVVNIVEITVTSNSCATNKATGSYRFTRK